MGARGPAPTKKRELRERGSWLAKHRPPDLELPTGAPEKPAKMKGEAAAEWDRVVPLLASKGALSPGDRAALIVLCEAWADYVTLGRRLAKVTTGPVDERKIQTMRQDAYARLVAMLTRFGLTPADRARVKVPEAAPVAGKARFFRPRVAQW